MCVTRVCAWFSLFHTRENNKEILFNLIIIMKLLLIQKKVHTGVRK